MGRKSKDNKWDNIKLIIFSDLHLELWKQHNNKKGRTKTALNFLNKIRVLAKRHKAIVLFCGDLFHKPKAISNELLSITLPKLSKYFSDKDVQFYAISGNHDQAHNNFIDKPSPSFINTFSKIFPSLHCIDNKLVNVGDITLVGIPYLTQDLDLIPTIEKYGDMLDPKQFNILMLHTTMPGAKDTNNKLMVSNMQQTNFNKAISKFHLVLCGHIHKPTQYWVTTTEVIQVGAPQQQRLTDKDCKMGYWVVNNMLETKFIETNYPKFVLYNDESEIKDDGNYYIKEKADKTKNKTVSKNTRDFRATNNPLKLAKAYCKEKGIKDSKKKKLLVETLSKGL